MTDFKLINYIIETILNLDDAELGVLTVSGITRRLNISKSLMYDLFKAKNITPAVLLNKIKISRAMALLENKEISVKEVSQRMGFHSSDYFIRLFKIQNGTTPGKYQRNHSRQNSIGK